MIFKKLFICIATVALQLLSIAETEISAMVSTYYQMRVKDMPTGVYEWKDRDLLFVQVHVEEMTGVDAETINGRILIAEHDELFKWIIKYVKSNKEEQVLSPGLSFLRDIVRKHYPYWEFTSEWRFQLKGNHFTRNEYGKRVCCAVCKKSEVLSSIPKSFYSSVTEDVWIKGGCELIQEYYCEKADDLFLWHIGLFDIVRLLVGQNRFEKNYSDLSPKKTVAYKEYEEVNKELNKYLLDSEMAKFVLAEKKRRETIPPRIEYIWTSEPKKREPQIELQITTNKIDDTNYEVVFIKKEINYESRTLQKKITSMAENPRFEMLFLSGGSMTNIVSNQIESGFVAKSKFFEKSDLSVLQRKELIIKALQENPGDKELWNLLARTLMSQEDWIGALISIRNCLQLDKEYDFALTNLAIIYKKLKCFNLSYGAAIMALGITKDDWCKNAALGVLKER